MLFSELLRVLELCKNLGEDSEINLEFENSRAVPGNYFCNLFHFYFHRKDEIFYLHFINNEIDEVDGELYLSIITQYFLCRLIIAQIFPLKSNKNFKLEFLRLFKLHDINSFNYRQ